MNNSFANDENRCEFTFRQLGFCWHLYTPENHQVILTCKEDYCAAMTLLAICALNFPSVRILTFQWMSNHLHITLAGPEEDIIRLFAMMKKYLGNYMKAKDRAGSLGGWNCKLRPIEGLQDLRNVIAYNNRNGFLVNMYYTPSTIPGEPTGVSSILMQRRDSEIAWIQFPARSFEAITAHINSTDLPASRSLTASSRPKPSATSHQRKPFSGMPDTISR